MIIDIEYYGYDWSLDWFRYGIGKHIELCEKILFALDFDVDIIHFSVLLNPKSYLFLKDFIVIVTLYLFLFVTDIEFIFIFLHTIISFCCINLIFSLFVHR